jgi:hypothetical protein
MLLIALPSCRKREEAPVELIVTAKGGLNLREKPDSKSARILTIPEGSRVTIIDGPAVEEKVGGYEGKWINVRWEGKAGYVFDRFLRLRTEMGRREGCPPFMLYRIVCLPSAEVDSVARKVLPPGPPVEVKLAAETFDMPPPLAAGSGVLVISRYGIIVDYVKSLSINRTSYGKSVMTFELGKDYQRALYMSIADIKHDGVPEPELISPVQVSDPERTDALLGILLEKKKLPTASETWFKKETHTHNKEIIRRHYTVSASEIKHGAHDVKMELLELAHRDGEFFHGIIALYSGGKLYFEDFGNITAVFSYRSIPYVALERWTPYSGDSSAHLFELKMGGLREIQKDDTFSD